MIEQVEFYNRRQAVLAQMADNSVAIIEAGQEQTRSNDTEYPFRQNSDFWYLTGFNEPDAYLVLIKKADIAEAWVFCRAKDKLAEIWNGRRMGPELAQAELAVDKTFAVAEFKQHILPVLDGCHAVYWPHGQNKLENTVLALVQDIRCKGKLGCPPYQFNDLSRIVHEMRLFKSATEIEIMQQAADISANAHKRAMSFSQAGKFEYQLEAEIQHEFAMNGARFVAYNSIVAGGDNANILHYTENSDELQDGDLVLIDAGCELQGYAADITRTFPVNGKFSPAQKAVYQIVLDAQLESMKLLVPGNTLKQATDRAVEVITQGLIDLGILHGSLEDNIQAQEGQAPAYRQFFMHGLGHWLGLDVHDVGQYKIDQQDRQLQKGMALTVEPGIYISKEADVPDEYKGIGIRIEDNIVITESGHKVLTTLAPKSIEDIEAWMQG